MSYSHRDRRWAVWLHRALESFVIDKELVGRQTTIGAVPKTLRPIFRDRDDFSAGHSLNEQTSTALAASSSMIVVCSPNSASSKYVNEEIRSFKALGRAANVIAVIVDGEPGDEKQECFPPALFRKVSPDGTLTEEQEEPLAADARSQGDGKRLALQKVVAGLLGVGLDEIVRRAERARRRKSRMWAALAAIFLCLAITSTASAVYAYHNLLELEDRLDQAIEIAYGFVSEASNLSVRFGVPTDITLGLLHRAETALDRLILQRASSSKLRYRKALMLDQFADCYRNLGQMDEAVTRATEALGIISSLAKDDPANSDLQEHLAKEFDQLAYFATIKGNTDEALADYRASRVVIEKLAAKDAANPKWQIMLLWNSRTIGEQLLSLGSSSKALTAYLRGWKTYSLFAAVHPTQGSDTSLFTMAKLLDAIGNVEALQGEYEKALQTLQRNLSFKQQIAAHHPDLFEWQFELRDSYRYVGSILWDLGSFDAALDSFGKGLAIDQKAVAADAKFLGPQRSAVLFANQVVQTLLAQGLLPKALGKARDNLTEAKRVADADVANRAWQAYLGTLHATVGDVLLQQGLYPDALAEYRAMNTIIAPLAAAQPKNLDWQAELAQSDLALGEALQGLIQTDDARLQFRAALAILDSLSATDPKNVSNQVDRLKARWYLAGLGDELVPAADATLTELRALRESRKLTWLEQKWLADLESKHDSLQPEQQH